MRAAARQDVDHGGDPSGGCCPCNAQNPGFSSIFSSGCFPDSKNSKDAAVQSEMPWWSAAASAMRLSVHLEDWSFERMQLMEARRKSFTHLAEVRWCHLLPLAQDSSGHRAQHRLAAGRGSGPKTGNEKRTRVGPVELLEDGRDILLQPHGVGVRHLLPQHRLPPLVRLPAGTTRGKTH